MLVKEYRIALPMSVDEYRIAQLYMIQKKSREESRGEGSGVEILTNEPYSNGPGGNGQYTFKVYHIGSHLPGWFRAILPKSALRVEEEAWNAYPYTKTRYRCPFVEKFLLEVETRYINDGGHQENIFNLTASEIKNRQLDYMDIVKDPVSSSDYKKDEDPKLYKSSKTGRGPLTETWWKDYTKAAQNPKSGCKIMTAYKLVKVEFKYWGMQNKIERFIHDIAIRKTMLRAHRQAWCWQDEWFGLQLSDIRRLERETQEKLAEKMANLSDTENAIATTPIMESDEKEDKTNVPLSHSSHDIDTSKTSKSSPEGTHSPSGSHRPSIASSSSKSRLSGVVAKDISASRLFESLEQLQEPSSESDDDEYFDARGLSDLNLYDDSKYERIKIGAADYDSFESDSSDEDISQTQEGGPLVRSSSNELLSTSNEEFSDCVSNISQDDMASPFQSRLSKMRQFYSTDSTMPVKEHSPPCSAGCKSNVLFLILHGGCVLETSNYEQASKRVDFNMVKSTFESVIRSHYPGAMGHIAFRLVPCPFICAEVLSMLSSLSPYCHESHSPALSDTGLGWSQEFVPLGTIPLFAVSNPDYQEQVNKMVAKANLVFHEFVMSDEGKGFTGQVCILADSVGSLLAYDALCQTSPNYSRGLSTYDSHNSLNDQDGAVCSSKKLETSRQLSHSDPDMCTSEKDKGNKQFSKSDIVSSDFKLKRQESSRQPPQKHLCVNDAKDEPSRRTSMGSYNDGCVIKFDFEVTDFFMLGSPLGLVLAYRRIFYSDDKYGMPCSPYCNQVYNLFHSSDPSAARIEPILYPTFRHINPVKIPRYSKFPVGDGEPIHVVETIQNNVSMFINDRRGSGLQRQGSVSSVISQVSGLGESLVSNITSVTSKWWGNKRLDYVLYCPEALHAFPTAALPHLFHSSFWESSDMAAFVLRQILRQDILSLSLDKEQEKMLSGSSSIQKEKWLKKRTTIKVKNLQANHRGNDVIVLEDEPQVISARFMYGSFDVTSLSGEKVDVHVMDQTSGEWKFVGTSITDKHGRLNYEIPEPSKLTQGMHSVKVVVRGDHTYADFLLTVLPPKTEVVVFSIDGSFTASMSISGRDPKVRAGAVDVVRFWQDQGYLILYVTARPDMQHRKVVSWLAMHNFPHGLVAFMDGLSKEPLKQKRNYLKSLQTKAGVVFRAGYGSSKDIYVYKELGLTPNQIFIVGKSSKKQQVQAQLLLDGYAAHLHYLQAGYARPAVGNARLFIRKGCISSPVPFEGKKSLKRLSSNAAPKEGGATASSEIARPMETVIGVNESGHTFVQNSHLDYCSSRGRGSSPRPKISLNNVPK